MIEAIAEDYDCVKTYNTLTPESAAAVHAAAKEVGIPVIGHVPRGARFDDAHLDDAQHLMGMTGPEGSHGPYPRSMSAWRNLDDERLDEIVRSAVARGIAVTPTLVVIDRLSRMHDHAALSLEFDAQLMPRYFRDVVWRQNPELTDADYVGLRAALARELELIAALHRAGVRIHAGTDVLGSFVVPGASMHRELQLFVDAGLTPEQAWEIATRNNGSFLPTPGLGTVTPGAPADLLLFSEDPTRPGCTGLVAGSGRKRTPVYAHRTRRTPRTAEKPHRRGDLRSRLGRDRAPRNGTPVRQIRRGRLRGAS